MSRLSLQTAWGSDSYNYDSGTWTETTTATPEPSSLLLLSSGGGSLLSRRWLPRPAQVWVPLLLLAGEVVTGGKQDRIIGKDRIVPVGAKPLPLDVFCVEHGRWSNGEQFSESKIIVHPSVREKAAVNQEQESVWAAVSSGSTATASGSGGGEGGGEVAAAPPPLSHEAVVGVVVAYGGEVAWSDVFASPELFASYWPKLLRSYVVEALARPETHEHASLDDARQFLMPLVGRETTESEPGVYRWREVSNERYAEISLDTLQPAELQLHWLKIHRST